MQDDGAGAHLIQRLEAQYRFPSQVTLLDGGTLGLDLLPRLEGVERLLLVDAIDTGGAPGTLKRLHGDEIPTALMTKLSPHQMGLQDLLGVAALIGISPQEAVLWGIQPAVLALGLELSPAVAAQMGVLEQCVVDELRAWGAGPRWKHEGG